MKTGKYAVLAIIIFLAVLGFSACLGVGGGQTAGTGQEADTVIGNGRQSLRILSGSENQELEPILEDFSRESGIRVEMTYQGSLDIMRVLEQDEIAYDAVWPASSLWLNVGDTGYLSLIHISAGLPEKFHFIAGCLVSAGKASINISRTKTVHGSTRIWRMQ